MKKYMILAAFAAALLAGGCAKEPVTGEEDFAPVKTVLKASLSPLTKTEINGVKVTWSAGDAINVNGVVSNALTEAAEKASFGFRRELTAPFKAIFPTTIYKDASTVTLPAEIGIDAFDLPLYGYAESGDEIPFKALTALVKLTVTGEAETTLKDVTLEGLGGEQLAGDFAIDYATGALTGSSEAEADKKVKVSVGKALSSEPLVIYIPIPAGNYASGFQVDLINSEGKIMRKAVTARTVKAGELRIMPELAYAPNVEEEESIGGIPDAAELKAFAEAVNAGTSISRWLNEAGEVELLADIDLGGQEWVPIGNGTVTSSNGDTPASGAAFTGIFNGGNHTVDNFKVTVTKDGCNTAGLFGFIDKATVKDLVIGSNVKLSSVSTDVEVVALGGAVAYALDSKLENIDSYATIQAAGGTNGKRITLGAVAGTIFALTADSEATNLKGHGSLTTTNTVNTNNGAAGFQVGGVIGFAEARTDTEFKVRISNCINYSDITAEATRLGGVIGTMNKLATATNCVNYGTIACKDTKAGSSRPSGIVSAMGDATSLTGCVNYGDIMFAISGDTTHGYAAGVVGQTNDSKSLTVIDGCASYGSILSDMWYGNKYMGIICADFANKTITVKNCILGGKIGPYTPTETDPVVELSASNWEQYYTLEAASRYAKVTFENNTFGGAPAQPGISTAEDLVAFAAAVNAGESIEQWESDGVVKLLSDIDLTGVDWTPIGNATSTVNGNYDATYQGPAFKGVFDGGDHTISGFTVNKTLAENTTFGLFGVLDGATVKNLKVEGTYTIAAASTADAGVIAGVMTKATIENVSFNGTINFNGCTTDNKRFAVGGIAGFVHGNKTGCSVIRNCTVTATVKAVPGSCTKCGATCAMYGGIAGFVTAPKEAFEGNNLIEGCTNNGKLDTDLGRCSGIVASANCHTVLKDCVNNADQVNHFTNGRIGNIACNVYYECGLVNCVNNGALTTSHDQTTTGGLAAMLSDATSYVTGGANNGTILGANTLYLGLLVANFSNFKEVKDVTVSGKLGVYKSDGNHEMYTITAENYMDYLGGGLNDTKRAKISGLTFVAAE